MHSELACWRWLVFFGGLVVGWWVGWPNLVGWLVEKVQLEIQQASDACSCKAAGG